MKKFLLLCALFLGFLAPLPAFAALQVDVTQGNAQPMPIAIPDLLSADPEVAAKVPPAELAEKFNLDYHFRAIDTIFARVFGE